MEEKIEKIQIRNLPQELFADIEGRIKPYVVSLLGVNLDASGEQVEPIGSGTLIKIADKYGILTVQHVTDELKKFDRVGLNIGTFVHKFAIDANFLSIVDIGHRIKDKIGPDLSFIVLPLNHASTIKALKSFWNHSYHSKSFLSKHFEEDISIDLWIVFGIVGMWTENGGPAGGFDKTKNCFGLFGFTGVEDYWTDGEFDYVKLSVLYENRFDLPLTFGGVSGGGIWRTRLLRSNDGRIFCLYDPLLSGVAFRQTPLQDNSRSIIGHGWRSIYEKVPQFVTDASSVTRYMVSDEASDTNKREH